MKEEGLKKKKKKGGGGWGQRETDDYVTMTMVTAMGMTGLDPPPPGKALSLRYVTGCQSESSGRGLTTASPLFQKKPAFPT